MKKLAPVALVLLSLLGSSCYKKHTCTCVKVKGVYNPDTLQYAIPRMKTTYATAECNAKAFYFHGVIYTCTLD